MAYAAALRAALARDGGSSPSTPTNERKIKMNKSESFYNLFDYSHTMHDAIDYGLVYEGITITRNIQTVSGKVLKAGDSYDAVWFLWKEQLFQFIDWVPDSPGSFNWVPDPETLIEIYQSELANFLHWNTKL